jgi:hypothetical protein
MAQTGLKEADPYDTPAPASYRSILPIDGVLVTGTVVTPKTDPVNLASPPPAVLGTSNTSTSTQGVLWRADAITTNVAPAVDSRIAKDARQDAKGVVLHVDEQSVQCEFLHGPRPTVVWLPRSLFPLDAKAGDAFNLGIETDDGYLAPKITARTAEPDPKIVNRISALLDDIES